MSSAQIAEELAGHGLAWLLDAAQVVPLPGRAGGLAWTFGPDDDVLDASLYSGSAGIVLALLEGHEHTGEDRYGDAALRGARALAAGIDVDTEDPHAWSLYFGLIGTAFALHAVADRLGDAAAGAAAQRALDRVRAAFDGERWGPMFELLAGNAGIGLGALAAGDVALAERAVEPYLRTADPTPGGVNWPVRPSPPRSHHMAHGTLGIVVALAAVARATGRGDLLDLALAGAADVVSRNVAGPLGFLVPHSDPPHKPEIIERYSYGWCNGPAGDAQAFRLLGAVTGDRVWAALVDRCWHTVTSSGLPRRLRPGFWDSSGRCCGTAGVLALAGDRQLDRSGGRAFADALVADLAARATVDDTGAPWHDHDHDHEHRATPPTLPPRCGWATGNAGIVRELMRHARIVDGRAATGYAVAWPDHF